MAYKNIEDQRAGWRRHYKNNKQQYLDRNKVRKEQLRYYIQLIKNSLPCMDCGNNYPYYVMDFDHRDPNKKIVKLPGWLTTVAYRDLKKK